VNVLVIAPHPDDEVIGCGGTVCLRGRRGDRVAAVFLTSGELGLKELPREKAWATREAEARAAARILGLAGLYFLREPDWTLADHQPTAARALRRVLQQEEPALIYAPHPEDGHPDHQAALPVLRAALKGSGLTTPGLRAYEVWTPLPRPEIVEDISAVMPTKLRALRAHASQLGGRFDYVRAVRSLNGFRGALGGKCRYAEAFEPLSLKEGEV
jgi:LmbE family N-acetylglucosaminyl deacetylase